MCPRIIKMLLAGVIPFLLHNFFRPAQCFAGSPMKTFQNPILPGFHPDPSICRVGDDFYLTNSTFEIFPGLPISHSRDLVHWEQIGNALDRTSQIPLKGAPDGGGLYAPTIRYWKGKFYISCTNYNGRGGFVVSAENPAGPWSEPLWLNDWGMDGSLFFDDDGKVYYTKAAGGVDISQAELDIEAGKLLTPFKIIYTDKSEHDNEGPHLYKIKGRYYLMLAEGGTGTSHAEFIGRSHSPWGPFERCPYNPILTERDDPQSPIQCTGHGDLFETVDGSWWMVFLGVRPQDGKSVLGRETFLAPVTWTADGWPIVNGNHHMAVEMPAPHLKPFPVKKPQTVTRFKPQKLGPEWIYIRNVDPSNFSLTAHPGFLSIKAAKDSLSNTKEEPAFVGKRQTAFRFTARTAMRFHPAQEGEEAGLCVRSTDDNHYEVGVEFYQGKTQAFLRNTVKGNMFTLARQSLKSRDVQLELSGNESQYQFAWSPDGKEWNSLGASPSADLSKEKAGGYTGTEIGLYASANGKESPAYADFAWFQMLDGKGPETIALSPRPTPIPPPKPAGTVYEAEDSLLSGGAMTATDHDGFSGKGFVAGYLQGSGQKTAFTVNVPGEGNHQAVIRYGSSMGAEQALSLYVNGKFIQKVKFKPLENWDTWNNVTVELVLKKGANTVALQKDQGDGCVNLDYLAVQ